MSLETELLELTDPEGFIKPHSVVDWARDNPESALHRQFEWDDAKAAEAFRVQQARRLISVHIVGDDGHRTTISLIQDRNADAGYRHIGPVMQNSELRAMALRQAVRELRRIEQQYRWLSELAGVFAETAKVEDGRRSAEAA